MDFFIFLSVLDEKLVKMNSKFEEIWHIQLKFKAEVHFDVLKRSVCYCHVKFPFQTVWPIGQVM